MEAKSVWICDIKISYQKLTMHIYLVWSTVAPCLKYPQFFHNTMTYKNTSSSLQHKILVLDVIKTTAWKIYHRKEESPSRCRKVWEVSEMEPGFWNLGFNSAVPWCYRQVHCVHRTLPADLVSLPLELPVLAMFYHHLMS